MDDSTRMTAMIVSCGSTRLRNINRACAVQNKHASNNFPTMRSRLRIEICLVRCGRAIQADEWWCARRFAGRLGAGCRNNESTPEHNQSAKQLGLFGSLAKL